MVAQEIESVRNKANIYGKSTLSVEKIPAILKNTKLVFHQYMVNLGYLEVQSVPISSGIDPTVRFIGSHISVMKPYFVDQPLLEPGVFMLQDCIRTRNAKYLFDDTVFPNWGSFFPSMGSLSAKGRLQQTSTECLAFLTNQLEIPDEHILVRVNSEDEDLLKAARKDYPASHIEIDSRPEQYYRHKIGMPGVRGRNYNIALRNGDSDVFSDIGNVIAFESERGALGTEVALGVTTILKQLYDLEHVLDCHPVPNLGCDDPVIKRKFQDAMLVSMVLFNEGLRPGSNTNRERLLRTYTRSLTYFRNRAGITIDELASSLELYKEQELKDAKVDVIPDIMESVEGFETDLKDKKDLTSEEQVIMGSFNHL